MVKHIATGFTNGLRHYRYCGHNFCIKNWNTSHLITLVTHCWISLLMAALFFRNSICKMESAIRCILALPALGKNTAASLESHQPIFWIVGGLLPVYVAYFFKCWFIRCIRLVSTLLAKLLSSLRICDTDNQLGVE